MVDTSDEIEVDNCFAIDISKSISWLHPGYSVLHRVQLDRLEESQASASHHVKDLSLYRM